MFSSYPWTKLSKDFIWAFNKKLTINNKFKETFQLGIVPLIDWSQSCVTNCLRADVSYFNKGNRRRLHAGNVTNCIKIILTVEELSANCVKRKNKRSSQIKWRYWLITDTANKKVGT